MNDSEVLRRARGFSMRQVRESPIYRRVKEVAIDTDLITTLSILQLGVNSDRVAWRVSTYTTTATLDLYDEVVLGDATGGAFSLTLPPVAVAKGKKYHIKKTDASGNAVTVDGDGSETIDGATTKALSSQYASVTIVCDGTVWWILD